MSSPPRPPSRTSSSPSSGDGSGARAVGRPSPSPAPVDAAGKTKDLLQAAPKLEMPKGGGALRGIGETFKANPATGSSSMEVPLPFTPGRGGLTPSVSLSYDSGAGNGVFGLGWSLGVPSIRRKTDKQLPRYRADAEDTFVLAGAEDLVAVSTRSETGYTVTRYQPRIEGANTLIERWTSTTTRDVHWRTRSPQNVARRYGSTAASRTADPADSARIWAWHLDEERDEVGNLIRYVYATDADATRTYTTLKRVQYGNVAPDTFDAGWLLEVVFDYGDHDLTAPTLLPDGAPTVRQDPFSTHKPGFEVRCRRLCRRVLVFHRFDGPDDEDALLVRSLDVTYDPSPVATTLRSVILVGHGIDGPLPTRPVTFTYIPASAASSPAFLDGIDDLPNGLDFSRAQWVDLDGEGLAGLLTEDGAAWWYKRNEGEGRLGAWRRLPTRPGVALGATQLTDLDGDGRLELVVRRPPNAGSWARTEDGGWEGFRAFRQIPAAVETPTNSRSLDVDGDGRADLLVADTQGLLVFRADGRNGWLAPERVRKAADEADGPVLLFANATESLFLADMDGDGLVDLVRVRNGSVCYWPNQGYGRFGRRVQMTGAPWLDRADRFDPKRVRLADVDGAGPADLIYVGPDRVRWWSNQSGNSFGAVANEPPLPGVADPITVSVADLRGDGTACLVWASPLGRDRHNPLRYLRLMSAGKPYLLQSVDNGYGRTTTLQYTPSTAFYLADRRALTPWATRLPFPVQCLSTVTVQDSVTGLSVVSTYAYHHGFFDGVEREFRGFGKVEQWDAEAAPGVTTDQLPPVRTVSWFHTGAWEKDSKLFETYAAEYFGGDPDAFDRLPCTFGTSGAALREAYRALKGRPLRVEVYAEDGGSNVPYVVTETAWNVVQLQAPTETAYGVFRVDPVQTLTAHYERDATDPRIQQELPLDVDAFGVVTRAATVLYPRRPGATTWDVAQRRGIVLVTRNEVLHDDTPARWHIGLPVRTRAWELAPEDLALFAARLTADDVRSRLPAVAGGSATTTAVLDWDELPPSSGAWLRTLADTLTTYDNDGVEAAVGTLGERALVWQRYQRVYTPTQVTDLDDRLDSLGVTQTLLDQGYVDVGAAFPTVDGLDGRWARSGTQTRDADHFYVPLVFTDPWGAETTLTWHPSHLVPASVVDDLGNTVAATYDTRSMQPVSITDPNGNVTLAVYDALGRLLRIARTGTSGEGDTLEDPTEELSYDLSTLPVSILHRKRETHADPDSRWIEARAYSDGAGNVVMQKVTAAKVDGVARWIGSGRVVLNNKGLPVKQYEPFFAEDDSFEAEEGFGGVTPVLTYDPLGRAIRVDLPNGTLRRVSFGPWNQVTWDENDTIDESTADAGLKATVPASHKNTPTTVALDVQGRVYKTAELVDVAEDALVTTLTLDVMGNPRVVRDARGIDIQTQAFDLLGRPIFTHSPDGGDVTALLDAGGAPRWTFKDGDLAIEVELDSLRRPVRTWEWETSTPQKWLRERLVYGEAAAVDQGLGRLHRIYDGAGAVEHAYDWKGNVTSLTRRFLADEEAEGDWTAHDGSAYPFTEDTSTVVDDLETGAAGELESEAFPTLTTYDALNRVVTSESPDGQVVTNTFNEGGQLQTVAHGADVVVSAITYNARGQRLSIAYANGATTTYTYEADTFRLATLVTVGDAGTLQDLRYTYDPVGNIVALENAAEDDLYYDNTVVSPDQSFAYDALYRLTAATGREKGDRVQPWSDDPTFLGLPNTEALRSYTEDYVYDAVGNFASMTHKTGTTTLWTRTYTTATTSNRLESTTEASGTKTYVHDARGNLVYLPHLRFSSTLDPNVVPSFRDQMRKALLPTSGHEAFYAYDAGGQRVRKVVKAGTHTERRYVGNWEIWREYDSGGEVEEARTTLHIVDDKTRVLMVETKTVTAGTDVTDDPVRRYQLTNHLGSVAVELDGDGGLISYEEFHPYGSTAWWAGSSATVSQKRYRYTGMERDDETGMQCHGVRYYAHWIGRWTSADPIGLGDGVNRFRYSSNRPVSRSDVNGMADGGGSTPSATDISKRFQVTFLSEKQAIDALTRELRVGKNIGEDRVPQMRAEVANRAEGSKFDEMDLRAAERALSLIDPFRSRSTSIDEGTQRSPLAIGRLTERSVVASSLSIVGRPITREQKDDEVAGGLALRQENTVLIFDAAHKGDFDQKFIGTDLERQLTAIYLHEFVHATILKDAPELAIRFHERFANSKPVSEYGERTRAAGVAGQYEESDEDVVEAVKQYLIDPKKFRAKHADMASFFDDQLSARFGEGVPQEQFVDAVYERAGQKH